MTEEKNKKQTARKYEVMQVPTEFGIVVRDTETGEDFDLYNLLCKIANDMEQLKRQLL